MVLTPTGLHYLGRKFPCSVGCGGLSATKREGDGAMPTGLHHITGLYYRPDRMRRPTPWARPIGPGDLWSDAPDDPAYNTHVRSPYAASHECLRRPDPLYDLILTTDWNWPDATAHKGSAIFLHQWRRPGYPTEGCLAFSRANLHWIVKRAAPGTSLWVPLTGSSV